MKIGQEMRARVEQKTFSKQPEGTKNFNKLVQSQFHKMKREELDQLMQDITKQGEKIARFRSFKDLATFKRMIKEFLEKTVYSGLELSESHHFSANSSSHTLLTVKKIDEKLLELTEDLMEQEKPTVDLLGIIGEINGLLINIYT